MASVNLRDRVAVTPAEAGELLGVGRATVYRLVKAGHLRPIVGLRTIRIARVELDRFAAGIDSRRHLEAVS